MSTPAIITATRTKDVVVEAPSGSDPRVFCF